MAGVGIAGLDDRKSDPCAQRQSGAIGKRRAPSLPVATGRDRSVVGPVEQSRRCRAEPVHGHR